MAQTLGNNPNLFDIPLNLIVADRKKNSRTVMNEATIAELAETIKREGQLTPVKVEKREDGKFDLVFGYRRHAAVTMLREAAKKPDEWTTLRAEVVEKMEPLARKLANIAENMAREDLTTYDQAVAFLDLRKEHDISGSKIANHVGKSVPYVNNLLRIVEGIDETVAKRWKEECQPRFGMDAEGKRIPTSRRVCTMDWLTSLVAKTPKDNQEYELRCQLGLEEPDDDSPDGDGDGSAPRQVGSPKRASMANLTKALEAAEAKAKETKGEEQKEMKGVVAALKYAMGKVQSIKNVYTNPKDGE